MSTEQPGLFSEGVEPTPFIDSMAEPVIKPSASFLPRLKTEEGYPEIYNYQDLHDKAAGCQRCRLRSDCQQVVFGAGKINADILFIGEAPGKDEDQQGIPFVGRAGQLLEKILQAADFKRSEVYITNVVKCRPPGNRLPSPDEVKECRNYLEAQIRIIKPRIIVCLGALASQTVIDPKARISQIRGRWFMRNDIKIIASYHPAALLRNENYKRPAWEDFKLIRDEYKRLPGLEL
jgi:uracil-DNA glycosylase family 4